MSELLRPEPPPSWVERARDAIDALRERPRLLLALGAVVVAIAAAVVFFFVLRPGASGGGSAAIEVDLPFTPGAGSAGGTTTTRAGIVVHVAGAVRRPGLYRLGAGSRVADAIDAAGGLAPEADVGRINLAAPVADGSRIYVLRRGEHDEPTVAAGSGAGAGVAAAAAAGPLDLNAATLEQLEALPGIGPATAQAIIDHRTRVGRFRSVDELLDVRGIGPAKLEQIRGLVRV